MKVAVVNFSRKVLVLGACEEKKTHKLVYKNNFSFSFDKANLILVGV